MVTMMKTERHAQLDKAWSLDDGNNDEAVSYTHLDVYKRQVYSFTKTNKSGIVLSHTKHT